MATAPPPLTTCPVCGSATDETGCPRCQASLDWQEQVEAIDFVVRRLEDWHREGRLTDRQWTALSTAHTGERQSIEAAGMAGKIVDSDINLPPRLRCWSCKEPISASTSHCDACGAPVSGPPVKSLRFYRFLSKELDRFEESGTITLRQAHELVGEVQERIAALKRKLEKDRAPMVDLFDADERRHVEPAIVRPRRSFLEVLLDPQSIQWLLASGGVLLVIGLVIWLSSLGLFQNAGVVAVLLGVGNAAILGGGCALTLATRHQFAGKALTLLACLVMPLNLWFYHYNGLITLEGHLWMAAVVCCVVYAAAAWVLKDPLFVYVLVGGVTLTGLLLLGEMHALDQVFAPVTLLIVTSLICLHAERAFPPEEASPFSRRRFGMAFYWSAQGLLASGLLILLGAQLIGWLHQPVLQHIFGGVAPAVSTREYLPRTLGLVLLGTYALIYSDIVVRRIGVYIYLAAVTLLWAEVQLLVVLDLPGTEAIVIITLALTGLAVNALQTQFEEKRDFLRTVPPLGVLLSLIPVLYGILLHFRATNVVLQREWPFQIGWPIVAGMLITALSCRAAAHLYRKRFPELTIFYFFATAAATLVFAAELLWMTPLKPWETQAPILMVIPVLYLIAAHLYRGHSPEKPLVWCAHASTVVMMLCSLYVVLGVVVNPGQGFQVAGIQPIVGANLNLLLAVFCAEVALFYGLAACLRKQGWNVYLATVMACGAIWQLLMYFHTPGELYPLAFSLLGLALLVAYRLALLEQIEWAGLSRAGFQSANALATLGFVAGVFLSLSRLLMSDAALAQLDGAGQWQGPVWLALYLMTFLAAVSLIAAFLVQLAAWRRAYLAITIACGLLIALLYHRIHPANPWQILEIVTCLVGVGLLILAHVGWYREPVDRSSEMVSLALVFGCMALLVPLFIASAIYRFGFKISPINELCLVASCVALLGSGIMCRLRGTTLFGAVTMALYILMVIVHLHKHLPDQLIVGIYITVGGAVLFGTGIVLSLYRDRLLALPERIKRREGIFRVFGWR